MEELSRTAQKTKNAVRESALRLFDEKGFDSVTIEEITQKAGVAKGSFYTYFSTKSDIIVDEFLKIDAYYESWAAGNLRRYKTGREKLLAFTRAQMKYVRDVVGNHNLKILYANQVIQSGADKILTTKDRQWVKIIRAIIVEGQDRGEFRTDQDAERLALLFNRSTRAVFLDWCIRDAEFDLVKEGEAFIRDWILGALSHPLTSS
ncbi:MAG: TetR/AcrR family transcriptional regulator [Treponemataceae bacterium]